MDMKKRLVCLIITALMLFSMFPAISTAASADVMMYEVYTSGGYASDKNTAPYKYCYVVLYNASSNAIDLSGWSLHASDGKSASFDAGKTVRLSGVIGAKGVFVVQGGTCADPASPPVGGELGFSVSQTAPNFVLPRKSGMLALCKNAADETQIRPGSSYVADFLGYGDTPDEACAYEGSFPATGISVKKVFRREQGADTDDNAKDFKTVDITSDASKVIAYNAGTTMAPVPVVYFSKKPGYYNQEFSLELSTNMAGDNVGIYYTTDGSDPVSASGALSPTAIAYNADSKIRIYDRTGEPTNLMNVAGTTDPAMDDKRFIWPPVKNDGESDADYASRLDAFFRSVFKVNAIKAVATNGAGEVSQMAYNTYIVNSKSIKDRFNLPVFSITLEKDALYGPETGLFMYNNIKNRGEEWERSGQIQFFDVNGALQFEDNVGISLNGGNTRRYPDKALRIYMRDHTLRYDLFSGDAKNINGETITKFDNFLLRPSGNDWYSAAIRDVFWQRYCAQLGKFLTQGYRPCITFINGEFWGIMDIRERIDEKFIAAHYNIDKDDVAIVDGLTFLDKGQHGDEKPLVELKNFIAHNDMSNSANYQRFKDEVDVDSYIDYMICEIYSGNRDWPHNNFRMFRNKNAANGMDTKWRPILHDVDYGFVNASDTDDTLEYAMTQPLNDVGAVLGGLMNNSEFRTIFVNRFDYLLEHFFIPDKMIAMLDKLRAEVETASAEHRTRWNLDIAARAKAFDLIKEICRKRGGVMRAAITKNTGALTGYNLPPALQSKLNGALAFVVDVPFGIVNNKMTPIELNDTSVRPTVINDRTLVPARFVTESVGGKVTWDPSTSTATCTVGPNTIQFTLDSNVMLVNNKKVALDVAAQTIGGRTVLPLRALVENLGMKVFWDPERSIIVVSPADVTFDSGELDAIRTQIQK